MASCGTLGGSPASPPLREREAASPANAWWRGNGARSAAPPRRAPGAPALDRARAALREKVRRLSASPMRRMAKPRSSSPAAPATACSSPPPRPRRARSASSRHGGLTQARALVPGLDIRDADPEADAALLDRLALFAARRWTPRAAVSGPRRPVARPQRRRPSVRRRGADVPRGSSLSAPGSASPPGSPSPARPARPMRSPASAASR